MDILTLNAVQASAKGGDHFNAWFPKRPVWCYHATSPGAYNGVTDYFGVEQIVPMRSFYLGGSSYSGHPTGHAVYGTSEAVNASYHFAGHSSNQPGSSSLDPASGRNGLCTHTNTVCFANIDFTDENGVVERYHSNYSDYARHHGIVLGEPGYKKGDVQNYVQGLEIGLYGNNLWVDWAGNAANSIVTSKTTNRFTWTSLTGLRRMPNATTTNFGMVCYNRVNNTLVICESTGSSSYYTYRLHIFKNLPEKIRPNDIAHLQAMLQGAINGQNGSSYEIFNFNWSGGDLAEWHYRLRIIYCDDHTVWLIGKTQSNFSLGRVYFAGNGARTFESVRNVSLSNSYGADQGGYYATAHMMSDDNSVVAIYTHYYYYLSGFVGFFVGRNTAQNATNYCYYQNNDTTYGFSIAPYGGKSFVLDNNSNADGNVNKIYGCFINNASMNGGSLSVISGITSVHGYSTSTSYGGTMVVKVKPALFRTTEYKEVFG